MYEPKSRRRCRRACAAARAQVPAPRDRRPRPQDGLQIDALEHGIEPELVGERIARLRLEKEQAEAALGDLVPDGVEPDADELIATLSRVPDLSQALRDAPIALKRQVFEAFCLEVRYDKVERRIEISATVAEAVAKAFENAKDLPEEVSSVTTRDIAGAGFEPATFGL